MPKEIIEFIKNSDFKKLNNLLDNGWDINKRDGYGYTPLIHAVIENKIAVATWLLDNGALVDEIDMLGWSALQWAADDNNLDICKLLLKYKASPNHYSLDGQPALVYPLLRKETKIIECFLKSGANLNMALDFINSKVIGHRFELKGKAHIINTKKKFVEINLEGFFLESTLGFIHNSLERFIQYRLPNRFPKYNTVMLKILNSIMQANSLIQRKYTRDIQDHEKIISEIAKEELIIIPIAFEGHAITMLKYKELFARCDRGVGTIADTVFIYKIGNPYTFNAGFLKKLIYENKTTEYMHHTIIKELDLKIITTLPTESQITGNCSWANVEAAVPALMFMILFRGDTLNKSHIYTLKKSIMNCYEHWVKWDRDIILQGFLKSFSEADYLRKAAYAFILGIILEQHCDPNNKQHIKRAKDITAVLMVPDYAEILKAFFDIAKHPTTEQGHRFLLLMKKCKITIAAINNLLDKKRSSTITKSTQSTDITMLNILNKAAESGELQTVKYLITKCNISPHGNDKKGATPLMYAAWRGHLDIVKYLITKHNVSVDNVNNQGVNALDFAEHGKNKSVIEYLKNLN